MEYNFVVTKIVAACFVAKGTGTPVHRNRPSHGLVMYSQGDGLFTFDSGEVLKADTGEILYLPKGSNYTAHGGGDCYAINFDISQDISFKPFVFKVKNTDAFLDRFKRTEKARNRKKAGFDMRCMAELYGIICEMQQEYSVGYISHSTAGLIQPATDYIHKNYCGENISIDLLADLCGISGTYLRRIFQTVTGTSPLKYINNLKIAKAKELILSDMYSLSEVAHLSGFHDEAYFSREFKRIVGVSPSQYK